MLLRSRAQAEHPAGAASGTGRVRRQDEQLASGILAKAELAGDHLTPPAARPRFFEQTE